MLMHCDPCCPPPTCDTIVSVTVTGCNSAAVPGASVTIKIGATTIGSGTTNGSGAASITVNSAPSASATIEIGAVLGYAGTSISRTLNCGTVTQAFGLLADTDHVCVACCVHPAPKTLGCTTVAGDLTLTYSGGAWAGTIAVSTTKSATCSDVVCSCSPNPDITHKELSVGSGSTTMPIQLRCVGSSWKVVTGTRVLYGRTTCSGNFDWGYDAATCTTGSTVFSVRAVDRDVEDNATGTCDSGVVALSGTISNSFASFTWNSLFNEPVCGYSGLTNNTVTPANPLAGSITVYDL
jgi:hypothetical protein